MSRVLIIEVPDKYEVSGKEIVKYLQEKFPDIGMLRVSNFSWWKGICRTEFTVLNSFPIFCPPNFDVDKLIEQISNPKSYEERQAEKEGK